MDEASNRAPDVAMRRPRHLTLSDSIFWGVSALIIGGAVYFAIRYWDDSLRADLLGSVLAATVALVVGIPIAFQINQMHYLAQSVREEKQKQIETERQKSRILGLIVRELEFNLRAMEGRRRQSKRGLQNQYELWPPLKTYFWQAVSDSGDTKYLSNASLLDAISHAYYRLNITVGFESKYTDAVLYPGIVVKPAEPPQNWRSIPELILDVLEKADAAAVSAIRTAINEIEKELVAIGPLATRRIGHGSDAP